MSGVGCFRWQSELLGLLGGNVCCWVFQVAMCVLCYKGAVCVVCSFRWQSVLLYVLGGNVFCLVF